MLHRSEIDVPRDRELISDISSNQKADDFQRKMSSIWGWGSGVGTKRQGARPARALGTACYAVRYATYRTLNLPWSKCRGHYVLEGRRSQFIYQQPLH